MLHMLDISQGLKKLRNRLTHEGFMYPISPKELEMLLNEVKQLEETLYPENKN